MYHFETLINIVYVFYCDCYYKQFHRIIIRGFARLLLVYIQLRCYRYLNEKLIKFLVIRQIV